MSNPVNTEKGKNWLLGLLKETEVIVTFTKTNGDERVMTCTLMEGIVPPATKEDPISQEKVRKVSDAVCCVWDVNAKGWRSFRWDNVKKVECSLMSGFNNEMA